MIANRSFLWIASLLIVTVPAFCEPDASGVQTPQNPTVSLSLAQQEYEQIWGDIQQKKQSGLDISALTYDRFFELEQQVSPEQHPDRGAGHLDQGFDGCPGLEVFQPEEGEFVWYDYGQNYLFNNDCDIPYCRPGRDVFYVLNVYHTDSIEISTCGSGFDTYLCINTDTCCGSESSYFDSNDDNEICGRHSTKSVISRCFDAGRYFIILDGYNGVSWGEYYISIRNFQGSNCGDEPPPPPGCPQNFILHQEPDEDEVCFGGVIAECEQGYCGAIDWDGEWDAYSLTLDYCAYVRLSVYGDDTPGHSSTGLGLNPRLRMFVSDACDDAIYDNDNYNGGAGEPQGNDSRITTECLFPGEYWIEVSGNLTTGPYEFTIECEPCGIESRSVLGLIVQYPSPGRICLSWQADIPNNTYYIWRSFSGDNWELIATTNALQYCEDLPSNQTANYQVYGTPCNFPAGQ